MVMGWHPADRLGHTQRRPPKERTSAIASAEATMRTPSRLVAGDCQDAKLSTYPAGGAGQLGGHDGQRGCPRCSAPQLSTAAHVSPVEREVACGVAYRLTAAAIPGGSSGRLLARQPLCYRGLGLRVGHFDVPAQAVQVST